MKITSLIIATRNAHKTEELASMLGNHFQVKNLRDFSGAPEAVESAETFVGNATIKAVTLANFVGEHDGWFVLADDSGLEVDALDGAPGVHSARFAAMDTGATGNSPDGENNAKLLRLLEGRPRPWKARFRCVLALTPTANKKRSEVCLLDEAEAGTEIFDGTCEGQIVPAAKGARGFGYDPLFVPDGFSQTFAELGEEAKNRISHRAQAMKKLLARLQSS